MQALSQGGVSINEETAKKDTYNIKEIKPDMLANITMNMGGLVNTDTVLVTGYSAGGFATALLSGDIFTNYFPNAKSRNVLVDAALLLNKDWHTIAENV